VKASDDPVLPASAAHSGVQIA
jgi:hypothetical protein